MNKRYRLNVPGDYLEVMPALADMLNGCEVAVVGHDGNHCTVTGVSASESTEAVRVKFGWLTEIKDVPESPGKIIRDVLKITEHQSGSAANYEVPWHKLVAIVKASEKNSALRHKHKQSMQDAYHENFHAWRNPGQSTRMPQDIFNQGWEACDKSRGFK